MVDFADFGELKQKLEEILQKLRLLEARIEALEAKKK